VGIGLPCVKVLSRTSCNRRLVTHANFFISTGMEELLLIPVNQLELSNDCIENLQSMHISNLHDLIKKGWQGLREMDGFDYIRFNEVVRLLTKHDLIHLLERPL